MPNPTPPAKRKLNTRRTSSAQDYARNETMEPSVLSKEDNDGDLDQVVAENPQLKGNTSIPSLSPASSGNGLVRGGTEAVAAYQRKLNSMGANLKVDGAWGKNTQAAFEQFQSKNSRSSPAYTKMKLGAQTALSTPTKDSGEVMPPAKRKLPTSAPRTPDSLAKEAALAKQGIPTIGDPRPYASFGPKQDAEMAAKGMDAQDWYNAYNAMEFTSPGGQKSKKVKGYQLYPNGRVRTPGGTMRNGTVLPKRKLSPGIEDTRLAGL